jgi:hypothetical protein
VDGVLMADPDPDDPTTGRQTLQQRVRQPALPMRLTGVASSSRRSAVRRPVVPKGMR